MTPSPGARPYREAMHDADPVRVTGCLALAQAKQACRDMAQTITAMRRPERVSLRRWGRGWAVFLHRGLDLSDTQRTVEQ